MLYTNSREPLPKINIESYAEAPLYTPWRGEGTGVRFSLSNLSKPISLANTYFHFKQFTIQQERCAMKVTTDGCLLGAIAAKEAKTCNPAEILDIGTGTGLLALMVTQQNTDAKINAIEIDEVAAQQAAENVMASPWAEKIAIIHEDVLNFTPVKQYDVIISNPPFYDGQLAGPNASRNQAHHSSGLTMQQLFKQVNRLIKPTGKFLVMLPYYRTEETIAIAASFNLYLQKHWLIQQNPKHSFFRTIFCFGQQSATHFQIQICIEEERNQYSIAFADLLKPYYLKL